MSVTFLALSLCKISINHTKGEDSKQYGGLVNLKRVFWYVHVD